MKTIFRSPLIFVLAAVNTLIGVSACTPPMSTDTPEIEGHVVNGATGLPITNARVSMDYHGNYEEVGTDETGHFALQALQIVNVPLFTPKNRHDGGTLKIEVDGFQTYTEGGLGAHGAGQGGNHANATGSTSARRTGPDWEHVRIALVPNA